MSDGAKAFQADPGKTMLGLIYSVAISDQSGNGSYMDESLDQDMWLLSGEQEERSHPSYWRSRLATRLKRDSVLIDRIRLSVVVFLVVHLDELDEEIRANESWRSFLRAHGGGFDLEYYGTKADLEYQYGRVAALDHHLKSFAKGHLGEWESQYERWLDARKKAAASPKKKRKSAALRRPRKA